MNKKMLALYIITGILIVMIIVGTVFLIIGMQNKPVNICVTNLTSNMPYELLNGYCKVAKEEADEYITKKEIKDGYLELLNDKIDVLITTEVDEKTKEWLNSNGLEIEENVIAKDALVFLNNINNPIENLTSDQIRGIYSQKYKKWSELGGIDEEIIAYRANIDTEEEQVMRRFMENKALLKPRYEPQDNSVNGLVSAITEYLDTSYRAIMYTTLNNIKNIKNDNIRILKIDGVSPIEEELKSDFYKGTMDIYAIIRKSEPENSQTRRFVEYIKSKDGQAIIEQCGYVNLVE